MHPTTKGFVLYTLRQADPNDYDFLYRLHVATMKEYVTVLWGWDEEMQQRLFRERFDPSRTQIVVVNGADAGVLRLQRSELEYFIDNIGIAPAYQGLGIGSAVIRDIVREANAKGLPVRLSVLRPNPARRLYERLGFSATEETTERTYMEARP